MILLMFFCIFLYNLGHPATPDLIELRHLNKSISGVFLAIMSSSMFLSSPYLGALADSIGMKKIVVENNLVFYLLVCISTTIFAFLIEKIKEVIKNER